MIRGLFQHRNSSPCDVAQQCCLYRDCIQYSCPWCYSPSRSTCRFSPLRSTYSCTACCNICMTIRVMSLMPDFTCELRGAPQTIGNVGAPLHVHKASPTPVVRFGYGVVPSYSNNTRWASDYADAGIEWKILLLSS